MTTPQVAVIGIPGKWSTEVLADRLEAKTGFRLVIDMADVVADLTTGRVMVGDRDLCALDGLVVKKIAETYSPHALDRLEMLRMAEAQGARVFSPTDTIIRMLDRLACTMTLRAGQIPMPDTIVTEDEEAAFEAVRRFQAAVFKPLYSTKARGMILVSSKQPEADIRAQISAYKVDNPVLYIQRKLNLGGRDYAMIFLGGRYLGSYARLGGDAWNTTIDSGGKYARNDADDATIAVASRAERLFGMDFTTVDIADGPDGPVVFEVSAFGGFKGGKEGLGLDLADLYADYIIKALEP